MQREAESNHAGASTPAPLAFAVTSREREPPHFAGLRGEDVDDWLDEYARVSAFNRWDDTSKLRHVSFSLDEVARTWFFNNVHRIDDWTSFCQELRKIFGTTTARSDEAKRKLATRLQRADETYTSYIEDIVALCRRVDASMSEADKVRHIMKGIASFAFNALAVQNPTSVSDVRTTCQRLDELQAVRLQPDALSTPSQGDTDLRSLIRQIIREELQLSGPLSAPRYHLRTEAPQLRDLVKEELASIAGVMPSTSPGPTTPTPSYAAIAAKPPLPMEAPVAHGHLTAISAASMPRGYYTNMHPGRQPFPGDRPVCYYCGIRGHISRFCRRRQQDERRGYAPFERDIGFSYGYRRGAYDSPPRRPSPPPTSFGPPRPERPSRRRSPSPYRRSVSPLRPVTRSNDNQSEN